MACSTGRAVNSMIRTENNTRRTSTVASASLRHGTPNSLSAALSYDRKSESRSTVLTPRRRSMYSTNAASSLESRRSTACVVYSLRKALCARRIIKRSTKELTRCAGPTTLLHATNRLRKTPRRKKPVSSNLSTTPPDSSSANPVNRKTPAIERASQSSHRILNCMKFWRFGKLEMQTRRQRLNRHSHQPLPTR
jgi:hypothetical protein